MVFVQIKSDLEKRMQILQEELLAGSWQELEARVQACLDRVEKTKTEIVDALDELKVLVIKEKFMTRV